MRKELKADLMLMFVAVSWGASNYAISICLTELPPLTINMFRFIIGFAVVALFGIGQLKKLNKVTLKYAFIMGIFLTGNYFFTNMGICYTTLSNAGFYCGLAVLFAPFGEWLIFKRRPGKKMFLVVALAVTGVFMMSMKGDFSFNTDTLFGDILCVCCALSYTCNILVCDKALMDERVNAYNIGALQIGFTFLWSSLMAFGFETPSIPHSSAVIWCLIFLGALCTGIAFVIEPVAQQYTSPSHVGLIFALEPVFCAIIAYFFADEVLFTQNYIGMVLLMAGIVILEVDFKGLKDKKNKLITGSDNNGI